MWRRAAALSCLRTLSNRCRTPARFLSVSYQRWSDEEEEGYWEREVAAAAQEMVEEAMGSSLAGQGDEVKVLYNCFIPATNNMPVTYDEGQEQIEEFVLGAGAMLPAFESTVVGMLEGQTLETTLSPSDAFGEWQKEKIVRIELQKLPQGLRVGSRLNIGSDAIPAEVRDPAVEIQEGRVIALHGEAHGGHAEVDLNHELAGRDLHFRITLLEVLTPAVELPLILAETEDGDGINLPTPGDKVTVEYTGWDCTGIWWGQLQGGDEENEVEGVGARSTGGVEIHSSNGSTRSSNGSINSSTPFTSDAAMAAVRRTMQEQKPFDCSRTRGRGGKSVPITFTVGRTGDAIEGWSDAVRHMSKGQRVLLRVPDRKALGAPGAQSGFGVRPYPPRGDLLFDFKLLSINEDGGE